MSCPSNQQDLRGGIECQDWDHRGIPRRTTRAPQLPARGTSTDDVPNYRLAAPKIRGFLARGPMPPFCFKERTMAATLGGVAFLSALYGCHRVRHPMVGRLRFLPRVESEHPRPPPVGACPSEWRSIIMTTTLASPAATHGGEGPASPHTRHMRQVPPAEQTRCPSLTCQPTGN
jgi:hypothetical protein